MLWIRVGEDMVNLDLVCLIEIDSDKGSVRFLRDGENGNHILDMDREDIGEDEFRRVRSLLDRMLVASTYSLYPVLTCSETDDTPDTIPFSSISDELDDNLMGGGDNARV